MRRALGALLAAGAAALLTAAPAQAEFALEGLAVSPLAKAGGLEVQAGSHPYALTTHIGVKVREEPPLSGNLFPEEEAKDVSISFPAGLVGNTTAVPRCSAVEFLTGQNGNCPDASALGVAVVKFGAKGQVETAEVPVYNLDPSPGYLVKLGFIVEGKAPVTIDAGLSHTPPYNAFVNTTNISQGLFFLAADVTIWGVPASPEHDAQRGSCLFSGGLCPAGVSALPFLTMPTSCAAPLAFDFAADSWLHPSPPPYPFQQTVTVHDGSSPPVELSPSGCAKLAFAPKITAVPTSQAAASASGLDFDLDLEDPGIANPAEGSVAASTIEKAVVTLPEGITVNPSQAEGLSACSEAQLAAEQPAYQAGVGCPGSSKIGTVEASSPLLDRSLKGALYLATPYANPYGSLIAIYMLFRDPALGVIVRQAGKVEPDPATGQLITTFEDVPDLPLSHLHLHFREGGRSPLITPPRCGTYTVSALFTPRSDPASPYRTSSSFQVTSGPGGAPCPPAGAPPFEPGFEAGTISNAAGRYSPTYMRITRTDAEQDITGFSASLPAGLLGKIAGIPRCPDAAIEAARARTGPHGGAEEQADPSCPAASQIGRVAVGAGVGEELTYVPGKLYLAGPYNGDPFSVAVITPALAGPFDAGTVVVREGLDLDPYTAQAQFSASASDPIPHILKGIPLKLRDLRVYADRPEFTLNPTSCAEESFQATVLGSGADPLSGADEVPFATSERFQAAGCARRGFKPKLRMRLKGATGRSGHPALIVNLTTRHGDANLAAVTTVLPHSEFIDPVRVANPCTRAQFDAGKCPRKSVLGWAKAWTPLLDHPLEGPVYFRSNGGARDIPDIVVDVHGEGLRFIQVGFVDSVNSANARIRTRFVSFPDAPVSRVQLRLKGGKDGLIENSANLCARTRRVRVALRGQNGRRADSTPQIATSCKKKKARRGAHRRR